MISLGRLMSATPIPIRGDVKFYQPTLRQVLDMGEPMYWSLLKIWDLGRKDMVPVETEETLALDDFTLWTTFVYNVPDFRNRMVASIDCFLHTKVEFLPISNTIMVGESDSPILLDAAFYYAMREISQSLSELGSDKKEEQYQETEHMSEREKQIIAKMKASAEKLDKIKNGERSVEDRLVKQIISLVAIGKYTFDEVYKMTIVQLVYLLKKYVEIQQYELYTALSPYMDSKKGQTVNHWLDT